MTERLRTSEAIGSTAKCKQENEYTSDIWFKAKDTKQERNEDRCFFALNPDTTNRQKTSKQGRSYFFLLCLVSLKCWCWFLLGEPNSWMGRPCPPGPTHNTEPGGSNKTAVLTRYQSLLIFNVPSQYLFLCAHLFSLKTLFAEEWIAQ